MWFQISWARRGTSQKEPPVSRIWAQKDQTLDFLEQCEKFGLFRAGLNKSETTVLNQLLIMFHECVFRLFLARRGRSWNPRKTIAAQPSLKGLFRGSFLRKGEVFDNVGLFQTLEDLKDLIMSL